jgi:hypothetical protein
MTELVWMRQDNGSYVSDRGCFVISRTPGRRFKLWLSQVGEQDSLFTGSLTACKKRAQDHQNINDLAATERQTKLDEQQTKQEEAKTPMGWASTDAPAEMKTHLESAISRLPPCRCCEIDFGQICPQHGRKLRGGTGNHVPVYFRGTL